MSFVRSSVKLIVGFWASSWWGSQSYLSREMRVDEAATLDGRWIPILCVSVLFHVVCEVPSWCMLRLLGGSLCLGRFMRVILCKYMMRVLGVLGFFVGKYVDGVVLRVVFSVGCCRGC